MYGPLTRQDALARLGLGASLSDVSRTMGISRSVLRTWQTNEGAYSAWAIERQNCPLQHALIDGHPYAHLLGLYLGDGCISQHRRGVYHLRVVCDLKYPRLVQECAASMRAVMPNKVGFVQAPGCVVVQSYSRHWPCLFPQFGPGPKHRRLIALAAWQTAIVEEHPGRLIRGLFHSDGCRVLNWTVQRVSGADKRYEYQRYMFSNESDDIMRLAEWALDLLGVAHRRARPNSLSVARRGAVAIMDQVVGPKN